MLLDAVSLADGDFFAFGVLSLGCGCPREVIPSDLYVVVGEFTELVVVHAEEFSFFGSAEVETGDVVDDKGKDGGDDKGIGGRGDDVGDLDVHLAPVPLEETSGNDASVDAVEADDVVGTENGIEEQTNHAADGVLSKHVESIVNAEEILDYIKESAEQLAQSSLYLTFSSIIAHGSSHDTNDNGTPWSDETRCRCSSNKTGDTSGTPADHGPFACESEIEHRPDRSSEHGDEIGVPAGHDSAEISAKGGTSVEAQPTEPQKSCSKNDEGNVVGTEVDHHLLLPPSEDH